MIFSSRGFMNKKMRIFISLFCVSATSLIQSMWRASKKRDSETKENIKTSLQNGANPKDFEQTLKTAIEQGDSSFVLLLLQHCVDPNAYDRHDYSPLYVAVDLKCRSITHGSSYDIIVQHLLDHGADINHRPPDGNTALHNAISAGRLDIMQWFLAKGANVNSRGCGDRTPLHCAAMRVDDPKYFIQPLLAKGADLYAGNEFSIIPLEYLYKYGPQAKKTAQLLLTYMLEPFNNGQDIPEDKFNVLKEAISQDLSLGHLEIFDIKLRDAFSSDRNNETLIKLIFYVKQARA